MGKKNAPIKPIKLIKKIEAKFPRDKAEKGELKIAFDGEDLELGREARCGLEYVLWKMTRLAGKKGTFRVVKVASLAGAGMLAGLTDDEVDYIRDIGPDLWFVIPKDKKDPTQEFGPCYTAYFKPE